MMIVPRQSQPTESPLLTVENEYPIQHGGAVKLVFYNYPWTLSFLVLPCIFLVGGLYHIET